MLPPASLLVLYVVVVVVIVALLVFFPLSNSAVESIKPMALLFIVRSTLQP